MLAYLPIFITIALFFAGTAITIRHFKIVRSVAYIERMNSPSMVPVRASVDGWLNADTTNVEKLKQLESDPTLQANVTIIYNLLTELAIAHDWRTVNRKMTYRIWFPLVPKYWHALRFYIEDARLRGKPIGHSFEAFASLVAAYNEKRGFNLVLPSARKDPVAASDASKPDAG